jgi:DNA-binding MarR family transcriptional regulator
VSSRPVRAEPRAASVGDVHAAIECLGRLAELYQRRREQLAGSVGLTDQQWGVLEEIATEHFMPSLFARERESSAAAVSKILRQIQDKGFVVATIAKGDARMRKYALTSAGKRVMERLRESREAAIREVWLTLDGDGMRAFTSFGGELIERLDAYASAAEPEKE